MSQGASTSQYNNNHSLNYNSIRGNMINIFQQLPYFITFYLLILLVTGRFLSYHDIFLPRKHPNGDFELKGYVYTNVEFQAVENITLRGWFIMSKNNPDNKTLFLIPGFMRTRLRYIKQIKFFVDSGYHVFTYDQRSHGASDTGRITYGPEEGNDLIAAFEYAKSIANINIQKTGVIGFSLGGSAAMYAGINHFFKAIVLEGVFADSHQIIEELLSKRVGVVLAKFLDYVVIKVGTALWTFGKFKYSYPAKIAHKISPTPIMLIWGERDSRVSSKNALLLISAIREPKTIWIHSGEHTQSFHQYPQEYKDKVLGFLNSHL